MLDPKTCRQPDTPGESVPKKPPSAAGVEANRRNSRRSPGPKTTQGKKNSSRNARKHNLLTKEVVITTGPGKEDENEFARLHAGLRESREPVGYEEEQLVEDLAVSHWLTRRARRSEKGAVTLGSELPSTNPELSEVEQRMLESKPADEARHELLQSSRGINHLLRTIRYVREELLSERAIGSVPEWLLPEGVWKSTFGIQTRAVTLKKEATRLTKLRVQVEQAEADREAAKRDLAAIPDKGVLDRTLRYENSNRRHRYRLEARLDQLQDRRRRKDADTSLEGEMPPPQKNSLAKGS